MSDTITVDQIIAARQKIKKKIAMKREDAQAFFDKVIEAIPKVLHSNAAAMLQVEATRVEFSKDGNLSAVVQFNYPGVKDDDDYPLKDKVSVGVVTKYHADGTNYFEVTVDGQGRNALSINDAALEIGVAHVRAITTYLKSL